MNIKRINYVEYAKKGESAIIQNERGERMKTSHVVDCFMHNGWPVVKTASGSVYTNSPEILAWDQYKKGHLTAFIDISSIQKGQRAQFLDQNGQWKSTSPIIDCVKAGPKVCFETESGSVYSNDEKMLENAFLGKARFAAQSYDIEIVNSQIFAKEDMDRYFSPAKDLDKDKGSQNLFRKADERDLEEHAR